MSNNNNDHLIDDIKLAAKFIHEADAILVNTGAGMGVRSNIGTFRGKNAGIWPPLEKLGMDFSEMSCPKRFKEDPKFAWSFWRFRYECYTQNEPHEGYHIIKRWIEDKNNEGFSYTSNIDGHWSLILPEDKVAECHGCIRYMQCLGTNYDCEGRDEIWPTDPESILNLEIDENDEKQRVISELPKCPSCGTIARPNVLMFGDGDVVIDRINEQETNLYNFINNIKKQNKKLVIVEIGAGIAVPTIRMHSERTTMKLDCPLIRINPEHPNRETLLSIFSISGSYVEEDNSNFVGLATGSEVLEDIDRELNILKEQQTFSEEQNK